MRGGTRSTADRGAAEPGPGSDFGAYLRIAREARGMELDEVAQRTRVRRGWLVLIEGGQLDQLPAAVFVRGFVSAYARTVGADEKVATGMLARRIAEQRPHPHDDDGPIADALRQLEGGGRRRVGVALAVLVLLIAATLMMSMLLRRPSPAAGPISDRLGGPSRPPSSGKA